MENNLSIEELSKSFERWRNPYPQNKIVIRTGVGGYDMFEEAIEREVLGTYRLYMPKKTIRIAKKTFTHKSASGRYFKRLKINLVD